MSTLTAIFGVPATEEKVADADYIMTLQHVIAELHHCPSEHIETVPVDEIVSGRSLWKGDVEVFRLVAHPRAQFCYAWNQPHADTQQRPRYFAVLGTRLIKSALDAVKFARLVRASPLIDEVSKLGERHND